MKKLQTQNPEARRIPVAAVAACAAVAIALASLSGCGRADKASGGSAPQSGATPGTPSGTAAPSGSQGGGTAAARTTPAAPEAKPVNLRQLGMLDGGELIGRSSSTLSYNAKGDAKSGYEFHRAQLRALGWREEPNASVTDQAASGMFTGAGYTISATVYPGSAPGSITVMLHNHGNVDLSALPLPPGTKPVYVGPLSSMHVTEMAVEDATTRLRALLTDTGWEPYGHEANSWHYKKGLTRITATITSAPAQGGKTMIDYSSLLLSADLPAPPDALDVRHPDTRQELTFASTATKEAILEFYKGKLAETGWKHEEGESHRIGDFNQTTFRTAAGDIIFLKVKSDPQSKCYVTLTHLSADDIAELKKAKPPVQQPAEKDPQ